MIQQQKSHQQKLRIERIENRKKKKNRKCLQLSAAGTERLVKVRGGKGKNFASFCVENKYLKLGILF